MKKSLIILASLFCLNGFSQSSIVLSSRITGTTSFVPLTPNQVIAATTTANVETDIDIDIKNTSSSTKSYMTKRYDIVKHAANPDTVSVHFCFNGSCYLSDTYTAGPLSLPANTSASDLQGVNNYITAELGEIPTVGYSLVKYTVYDAANPSDSVQISIKYNATLGVSELSANALSSVELFPNPATDAAVLKVTSQKAMDAKVIIYNALGAIVSEKQVAIAEGKNKIDLNINELNAGVYFAQVKMANSAVTKRLIIK